MQNSLGFDILKKYYIFEVAHERETPEKLAALTSHTISKEEVIDFAFRPGSKYQFQSYGMAFMFLATGIALLSDSRGIVALVSCTLMLAGRCNWVYGNPTLYDVDI